MLATVRTGDVRKLLLLCNDTTALASSASVADMKIPRGSASRPQKTADVDFIPMGGEDGMHGAPAIHVATARGDAAMVSALLNKSGCGADVDLVNPSTGYTPLHLAVVQDDATILKLLIEVSLPENVRYSSYFATCCVLHLFNV